MDLILKGLNYDKDNKVWNVTYPWIKDPYLLPNNYKSTYSKLLSTENRLSSLGSDYAEKYDKQIVDMVDRETATKIPKISLSNYDGPIHFLSHHEIHNSKSLSTPLRIVFNPSASFKRHVLMKELHTFALLLALEFIFVGSNCCHPRPYLLLQP